MAPKRSASSSLRGLMSTANTSAAPKCLANCRAEMPRPPTPKIATVSPGRSRALFKAWSEVADEHIRIAPCSNGISSGKRKTLRSGTTMNSAYPPSRCFPII